MAGIAKKQLGAGHVKSKRGTEESPFAKWTLIAVALSDRVQGLITLGRLAEGARAALELQRR